MMPMRTLHAATRTQCSQRKNIFNNYLKNDEALSFKKKKKMIWFKMPGEGETAKVRLEVPGLLLHASSMEERKPAFQEVVISVG